MGGDATLTGPDLAAGVRADALQPGEKLLGHARGEPVLLARIGKDFLAIGATCTHYGGPLADGIIDGETVRCPWHHACFNLRTGEALRAPALSPIACFTVERVGDTIRVGDKVERDALAPSYPLAHSGAHPRSVVIIGAGAAGSAAAEMLRRCGFRGDVTLVDDDPDAPYDRPNLSKDYLAGNAPEEWIPLRPKDFHSKHGIHVRQARATAIDVAKRQVALEGGESVGYGALLIATGADPIVLPIPGVEKPHVHVLRTLAHSRAIIAAAARAKHAVVIGASFIGLEVAASLRARGLEVHVVAPESLPLERVLGRDLGQFIESLHRDKGVVFHLGHKPERIEESSVIVDDGTRLSADLVVIGVGVRPRLTLAESAGLAVDRGVLVDEFLRTSAADVYAAGDIARFPDPRTGDRIRVEHWVVAQRMGQTAARNVLGARERFGDVPFFWSAHYDATINYVGHAEQWDAVRVDGDLSARDASVRFMRGETPRAVATVSRDLESLRAELEMERR
ncbi:MAG TPA: FAD-dependent oxidoreductase [Gemmatimonadaceae bacterium]